MSGPTSDILAIPRNIDARPDGGVELFASVFGTVPNDGAAHVLQPPAGAPAFVVNPNYLIRVAWARVEWSTVDLTVPPPLTMTLLVSGAITADTVALSRLTLQPIAIGTPAMELALYTQVQPNAGLTVEVTNTGAVSQLVAAYLWGWAYPQTLEDGASYGR